ncbi:MAG: transcription factor [Lysobacterales bacterium CG02_land_8_20_14_3_00_62_12]|nr:MAG: transcription factor [Xanthomonadales bacterium CG02_land_8_20_14_3_00_62_12]
MKALPIEVSATARHALGMSAEAFLRDYWQKRPLLIRQAFKHFQSPITPNDLAGLACEPCTLSRLVLHKPRTDQWKLESGPFTEARFKRLPKTDWTLLVHDVDKWDADVAKLYQFCDFLPSWRLDDIMISYAEAGGSVGAHVDQYDVFLLQALGQRRWQIDARANPPLATRDNVALKLLKFFHPSHDWLLAPGDVLYLPPGVPHHGVACNPCMTILLGMRAPSESELLLDLVESIAISLPEDCRYGDPDLRLRKDRHAIAADDLARITPVIDRLRKLKHAEIADWFGGFISRYRAAQTPAARAHDLSAATITRRLNVGARLHRHPFSRIASRPGKTQVLLYLAGDRYRISKALYAAIIEPAGIANEHWQPLSAEDRNALCALVNAGHFALSR